MFHRGRIAGSGGAGRRETKQMTVQGVERKSVTVNRAYTAKMAEENFQSEFIFLPKRNIQSI